LRVRGEANDLTERFLTKFLADYEHAARFLRVLDGTRYETFALMLRDIRFHVGNPKYQVNWSDPGEWIPERLCGDSEDLAARIWRESNQLVNPRWSQDLWRFVKPHSLVEVSDGVCALTDLGRRFVNAEDAVIRQIDQLEGIYLVLSELAAKGSSRLNDLIDGFREYCHLHTSWKSDVSIRSALRYRLNNLRNRELIVRSGHAYEITDAGLALLRQVQITGARIGSDLTIAELAKRADHKARQELGNYLKAMNPYQFEHLIKRLLEEMGYDNVSVTAASNDKGVDVTAEIEMGITKVNEVIQVKRQQSNVGRGILDGLRGSLHRFDAVQATVITTSGFSIGAKDAAFERGAAPITLIDGERLIGYLIEYGIGVRRQAYSVLEFDADSLSEFETEEELEAATLEKLESE